MRTQKPIYFLLSLVFATCFLSNSSGAEIVSEEEGVVGIYLCTRDLGDLSGKDTSEKRTTIGNSRDECRATFGAYEQNRDAQEYTFLPYADIAESCHYFLRHCFVVRAVKLKETVVDNKKLLKLKYLDSFGFTGLNEAPGAAAYAENMFANDDYKKETISCQVAFDERNITEEDLWRYEVATHRAAILFKWAKVMSVMDEETNKGYNAVTHNCCTVAFRALESINPDVYKTIDPSQINFGVGVDFFNPKHIKWILYNP